MGMGPKAGPRFWSQAKFGGCRWVYVLGVVWQLRTLNRKACVFSIPAVSPWLWENDCFSPASLASSVTWEGAIEQVQELNTAGPQITSFRSTTFQYSTDEMP